MHLLAALVAAAAGLVLGAGAVVGRPGVVVTVALAQVVLAPVWMLGTDRPGRIGGLLIGLGAAAAGDVALLVRDRTSPAVLLGVLGLALPAMVVHQLVRGVVRVRVTESVAAVAVLVAAEVALCLPIALARADDGHRLVGTVVLAATAGLTVARLTDALVPVPRIAEGVPYGLGAVVLAAVAGAAAGAATAGGPLTAGAGGRGGRAGRRRRRAGRRRRRLPHAGAARPAPPAGAGGAVGAAAARPGRPPSDISRCCLWQGDRAMRRLLIVLVVLAALLVVADRVGVVVAENRLAGQIQQQLELDSKPDVSIRGIPFLTQAISGTYKDIRVKLPDVDAGDVQDVTVDARLQGAHVSLSDALGGSVDQIPVDRISGTLLIPYDQLARRQRHLRAEDHPGGRLAAADRLGPGARPLGPGRGGRPGRGDDGRIAIDAEQAEVAGIPVPQAGAGPGRPAAVVPGAAAEPPAEPPHHRGAARRRRPAGRRGLR